MSSQLLPKWPGVAVIAALSAWPAVASAEIVDAGPDAEADAAAADAGNADAGNPDGGSSADQSAAPPLECGGALCDSSNGSTCAMSTPAPAAPIVLFAAAVLPLAALARRRRR